MEIPDNLASELESKLSGLMRIANGNECHEWVDCGFCGADSFFHYESGKMTAKPIEHDDNCLGVSLQRLFEVD